jgi:hypothetical protein
MFEDLDRQCVEELVREDDQGMTGGRCGGLQRVKDRCSAGGNVVNQTLLESNSQRRRLFDQPVS